MKKLFFILALALTLCGCKGENNNASSSKKDGGLDSDVNVMIIEGVCIEFENGSVMIVKEDIEPIVIGRSDDEGFKNLTTGDTIRVECDMIRETYPAQTDVSKVELVEEGDISDVPESVLNSLEELGWVAVLE